jgi:creatinine amidohydrolase
VNGHGGNNHFLHYFCQIQLANHKDYAMILFSPASDSTLEQKIKQMRQTTTEGHADEMETSMLLAHLPELAHVERGKYQSGEDLNRLQKIIH